MSRIVTSDVGQCAQEPRVRPFVLVELDFPEKPIRAWTGIGTITWDGKTWTGVGDLGRIGPIEESADLRALLATQRSRAHA